LLRASQLRDRWQNDRIEVIANDQGNRAASHVAFT
jgi:hypothetical protein